MTALYMMAKDQLELFKKIICFSSYLQARVPRCQHTAIGSPLNPKQILGFSVKMLPTKEKPQNHLKYVNKPRCT